MARGVEQGQILRLTDAEGVLAFLKGFAERFHQGKEEGVLFPTLLRDRSQKYHLDLSAAIFEHDRQRSLMDGLDEAMRTGNAREFVYFARRLSTVLRDHINDEEQ